MKVVNSVPVNIQVQHMKIGQYAKIISWGGRPGKDDEIVYRNHCGLHWLNNPYNGYDNEWLTRFIEHNFIVQILPPGTVIEL